MKVANKFKLSKKTLFLAYQIIDSFVQSLDSVSNQYYHLIGVSSLFMASKFEEIHHPKISSLSFVCNQQFSAQQIIACEQQMLVFLAFETSLVTAVDFLDYFQSTLGLSEADYQKAVVNAYVILLENCQFSNNLHISLGALISIIGH